MEGTRHGRARDDEPRERPGGTLPPRARRRRRRAPEESPRPPAGQAAPARRDDPKELRDEIFRRWVDASLGKAAGGLPRRPPPPPSSRRLRRCMVQSAAPVARPAASATTRSSSSTSGDPRGRARVPRDGPRRLQARLAEANNARLLDLSRADLVQAMDPEDVGSRRSLTSTRPSTSSGSSRKGTDRHDPPTPDRSEPTDSPIDRRPARPTTPASRPSARRTCPELFHAVAYRNDIWKADPFDVESIHEEARTGSTGSSNRAGRPPGLDRGRILLLLGESGSGKTHLMRAFRNWVHRGRRGYCGYMQMTASTDDTAAMS